MNANAPRLLLTVNEACESLQLSRPVLYGLIHSGQLESITIGRSRRIPFSALEDFIEAKRTSRDDVDGGP
jgi:excisionase family DNA binding protein